MTDYEAAPAMVGLIRLALDEDVAGLTAAVYDLTDDEVRIVLCLAAANLAQSVELIAADIPECTADDIMRLIGLRAANVVMP